MLPRFFPRPPNLQLLSGSTNFPKSCQSHCGMWAGSPESLDLALLAVGKGRVHQDGIHFRGQRFTHHLLTVPAGEEVVIRYDPQDMTEVYIFYRNTFICQAVCQELLSKPSN